MPGSSAFWGSIAGSAWRTPDDRWIETDLFVTVYGVRIPRCGSTLRCCIDDWPQSAAKPRNDRPERLLVDRSRLPKKRLPLDLLGRVRRERIGEPRREHCGHWRAAAREGRAHCRHQMTSKLKPPPMGDVRISNLWNGVHPPYRMRPFTRRVGRQDPRDGPSRKTGAGSRRVCPRASRRKRGAARPTCH